MKLDRQTVGKRYAKALFEYANDQKEITVVSEELTVLRQALVENPSFALVLSNAHLTVVQKDQIIAAIKQPFSKTIQNFIQMIYDYQRVADLEIIIDEFEQLNNIAIGRVAIKAITPTALTDQQRDAIGAAYLARFGGKSAVINNVLDPKIIGGVILEAEGRRIDGSVVSKLKQIRSTLAQPLSKK